MPKFSIAIPCKNRARTLKYTLLTCINQDFDDYEIILFDNCSEDNIKEIVDELNNSKIKYFRSDIPLCMSDSWDQAVQKCTGDYILLIGNNDGLLLHCLSELDKITKETKYRIIRWNRVYYTWPDDYFTNVANRAEILIGGSSWKLHSKKTIHEVVNMRMDYTMTPMLYTSAIHKSVVDMVINRVGRVFNAAGPDTYSGFAFASCVEHYISIGMSLTINGCTDDSVGFHASLECGDKIGVEEQELNKHAGFEFYKGIPQISDIGASIADCFTRAKIDLFSEEIYPYLEKERLIIRLMRLSGVNLPIYKKEVEKAITGTPLYQWYVDNFMHKSYDEIINSNIVIDDQNNANKPINPKFDGRIDIVFGKDAGFSDVYGLALYFKNNYNIEYSKNLKDQLELG